MRETFLSVLAERNNRRIKVSHEILTPPSIRDHNFQSKNNLWHINLYISPIQAGLDDPQIVQKIIYFYFKTMYPKDDLKVEVNFFSKYSLHLKVLEHSIYCVSFLFQSQIETDLSKT